MRQEHRGPCLTCGNGLCQPCRSVPDVPWWAEGAQLPVNQVTGSRKPLLAAPSVPVAVESVRVIRTDINCAPPGGQSAPALDRRMDEVSLVSFQPAGVDRFRYSRLNADYVPLHRLCRLLLDGMSLSEEEGRTEFDSFLVDMNARFERFVGRMFELELGRAVGETVLQGEQLSVVVAFGRHAASVEGHSPRHRDRSPWAGRRSAGHQVQEDQEAIQLLSEGEWGFGPLQAPS